ncbi:MAG: 3-methyl-2-oxobutanoate hydroxymethyltransferase [Epsilonproteobacteria bacterium]|nr:3-methyl-2-oxobutanoate hydroxymethyltransferase [Campylobacterota bacterium]
MQTISSIKKSKSKTPIVMMTAYDALFASLFDTKVDIILVGDSLNMSFNAKADTLSATLEIMIYHTKAVCQGAKDTLIVCDMPFGTYTNKKMALKNASKIYRETNAHAVKIEGGSERAHIIKTLTSNSIAVMGHIGLMPQFVRRDGGYKIRGKDEKDIKQLMLDAKAIEEAGAFCLVIEGVKAEVAKEITKSINIPTIGIGSGVNTDGQVLVWSDAFGFFKEFKPKFVKKYLNGAELVEAAVERYCDEVKTKKFPAQEHTY